MSTEALAQIIREARGVQGLNQAQAAEEADITLDQWKTLETRRANVRLPADKAMLDRVAPVVGRKNGEELLREAGLL